MLFLKMKGWLFLIILLMPLVYGILDIGLEVNLENNNISFDESLDANIIIRDNVDMIKTPLIVDFVVHDEKIIMKETKTLILDDELNLTRGFYIPKTEPGIYTFSVNIEHNNKTYTESKTFQLYESKSSKISRNVNYLISIIITLIIISVLVFVILERLKLKNISKNLDSKLDRIYKNFMKRQKKKEVIKKLEKKKKLLQKAYKSKYISKKTYNSSKNKINKIMSKINNRKL